MYSCLRQENANFVCISNLVAFEWATWAMKQQPTARKLGENILNKIFLPPDGYQLNETFFQSRDCA